MELITNILIEYLKHNKRIIVPKLGAFIVKQPSGIVRFSELMRNDDGTLRSLLVAYGMSELEANGKIDRFVFEIRHAIGQKQNFILDDFGEFRAGDNNTITFIHKSEPRVIGGTIKPPVETLNIEKQKLQPSELSAKESVADKRKSIKTEKETKSTLTLNKPDDYLRGLNYDDRKKRHSDDRKDKRNVPKGISPLRILLILIVIIGVIYGGWRWIESKSKSPVVEYKQQIIEEVASPIVDTLMLLGEPTDSLNATQGQLIDSLSRNINNTVTE